MKYTSYTHTQIRVLLLFCEWRFVVFGIYCIEYFRSFFVCRTRPKQARVQLFEHKAFVSCVCHWLLSLFVCIFIHEYCTNKVAILKSANERKESEYCLKIHTLYLLWVLLWCWSLLCISGNIISFHYICSRHQCRRHRTTKTTTH